MAAILAMTAAAAPVLAAPKIALVLSGGGARGLAQIGVFKALEEAGIRPSLIVGNSMGAVVGSLFAAGYSADSIANLCRRVDWTVFFQNAAQRNALLVSQKTEPGNYLFEIRFVNGLRPVLPSSISNGQAFYDLLIPRLAAAQYRCGMDFDSLPIPLRIVATDIVSGESVVFSHGDLATLIRASSGVPLAFSPVAIDTMLLVDGGITANIPVEAAEESEPDLVVAVDVTSPMWPRRELDNPLRIADQIVNIGITHQKRAQKRLADVVIEPDLVGFLNTDFAPIDTLIRRGYWATRRELPRIDSFLTALAQNRPDTAPEATVQLPVRWTGVDTVMACRLDSCFSAVAGRYPQGIPVGVFRTAFDSFFTAQRKPFTRIDRITRADPVTLVGITTAVVEGINITGNGRTSSRLIRSAFGAHPGDTLTNRMLSRGISSVFATDLFDNVSAEVDPSSVVRVRVKEKKYLRVRTGLRFDEFHLLEGYVQPAYENLFGWGVCASLHLQYGPRREKYAFDLLANQPFARHLATSLRFQAYVSRETIREEKVTADTSGGIERVDLREQTLRKIGLLGLLGSEIGRSVMLQGGMRIEQFRVRESQASLFNDRLGNFRNGIRFLMARVVVDNTDNFPFPSRGQKHYFSIGGAHAALGGTESFLKIDGSMSGYATFARRHTVVPRLQFSWASTTLPDVERFFLGGVLPQEKYQDVGVYNYISFVGLGPRSWPSDIVAVAELSYRFAVRKDLFLTAVADWGYAWAQGEFALTREVADDFLHQAPLGCGLGVAWNTVIGPICFTWGRVFVNRGAFSDPDIAGENAFYLSAGHDF